MSQGEDSNDVGGDDDLERSSPSLPMLRAAHDKFIDDVIRYRDN